jgi:hypothetical protein
MFPQELHAYTDSVAYYYGDFYLYPYGVQIFS